MEFWRQSWRKNCKQKERQSHRKKNICLKIICILIYNYKIKSLSWWRTKRNEEEESNIFHSHNILVPFLLAPRDIRKEISIGLLISFLLKSSDVPCSIGSWLRFLVGFPSVSCKVDCDAEYNKAHNNFYHFFSGRLTTDETHNFKLKCSINFTCSLYWKKSISFVETLERMPRFCDFSLMA